MNLFKKMLLFLPRRFRSLPDNLREGRLGEDYAARYLLRHGYDITERNFISGKNEIDIIAKKKNTYVFCEVKTRVQDPNGETPFGRPASAVDADKQRHLIAAATTFERRHAREGCFYRFDVIEVYMKPGFKLSKIIHMENAFMRASHPHR